MIGVLEMWGIKVMPVFNTSCLVIKHRLNGWFQKTSFLTIEKDFKKKWHVACEKKFKEAN
jgi:hypothetical protein